MTDPMTDLLEQERGFYRAALQFIDDYAVEFIAVEVICWIPELHLAGTIDWIARIGGRVVIGDWKTRAKGHAAYPEETAQLGTYSLAQHLVVGKFPGELVPFPEVDALMVVSLRDDGSYAAYPIDLNGARETAEHMAGAHYSAEDLAAKGTRAVGDPMTGQADPEPLDPAEENLLTARRLWLQSRVRALTPEAKTTAARCWPASIPKKAAVLTGDQIGVIAACLDKAEKDHTLPFFAPDPAQPKPAPGSGKPKVPATPARKPRTKRSTSPKQKANKQ